MDQSPLKNSQRRDEPEFNLKEWALKARISRENTNSRRFSASNIRSFREDTRSFRSNITISSTASSPGYPSKDEIDPATYSFTTALKALQARSGFNSWECVSPDGFALNSKWNEAEKYICNPLSGEVPMECLSAKTLSGRSFRNLTSRITMSAPLVYSSTHSRQALTKPSSTQENFTKFPIQENREVGMTRDVGTQSTPPEHSSSSPSPASTPSIIERSLKRCESPPSAKKKFKEQVVEMQETRVGKEETKREKEERKKADQTTCMWREGGCLSWMRKRQREKHKQKKTNFFLPHAREGAKE